MIRSDEIDAHGRRRVFETVGFAFLNRLLATSEHSGHNGVQILLLAGWLMPIL
jgi:hypothetical protein